MRLLAPALAAVTVSLLVGWVVGAWPPAKSLIAAALGGLICGWGARLGFGCNIGAFIGGVGSGSLHGWIWFVMALAGCWVGIRLRPLFGLSRD